MLGQHPTERGVAEFEASRFDRVLHNTGTLEQLRKELEWALNVPTGPRLSEG
jgi:hypothetical protein